MNHPSPPRAETRPRDHSLWLLIAGCGEILVGLGLLALIPFSLAAWLLIGALDPGAAVATSIQVGILGAAVIALGVGVIRARRWARELSLSFAWVWLLTGLGTAAVVWLSAPILWRDLVRSAGVGDGAAMAIGAIVNLVVVVVFVVVPGALVLMLRAPPVIDTCRRRDPEPGSTGRRPQRVKSLAVVWALGGLGVLSMPAYGYVFPIFGALASGPSGALCWAVALVVACALARGTWRRELWAWWTGMAVTVAAALSSAITFAVVDGETVIAAMSLPPDQQIILRALWPASPWIHVAGWSVAWGSLAGYLVVVRPLFGSHRRGSGG